MPTVNLFLPPLLGGFLFVSLWYPLRYWTQRESGYKLVFAASIAGGAFLLAAHLLVVGLEPVPGLRQTLAWWRQTVPLANSAEAVLGFLLGATLWWPLNLLGHFIPGLSRDHAIERQILQAGDPFEITLFKHLESQALISVTLKSGKVYIGRVNTSINPARRIESVRLSLLRSGYRDKDTHALILNVDYQVTHARITEQIVGAYREVIDEVVHNHPQADEAEIEAKAYERVSGLLELNALAETFEVVILSQEIVTLSPFEPKLFDTYFSGAHEKSD